MVHFIYAIVLTLNNYRARGSQRYAVTVQEPGVTWASKNMLVLGVIVLLGLLLHLYNFWAKMQLVEILGGHTNSLGFGAADGASLIAYTFSQWYYVVLYLVWFAALWFHLTHGVWSMFQTVGWANDTWYPRLEVHRQYRGDDRVPRVRCRGARLLPLPLHRRRRLLINS